MQKIGIVWCSIWLCLMEIVQPLPSGTVLPYRPLSKEKQKIIALQCIDETRIDRGVVEKVLMTQDLPKNNRKYKDFLACSYRKQGFLSADGKAMLYDNLVAFLEQFYTKAAILQSLERCKQIREEDPGELCFQNLDCILEGLRQIDLDMEMEENAVQ